MANARQKQTRTDQIPSVVQALMDARQEATEKHLLKQQDATYTIRGLLICVLNSLETEDDVEEACLSLRHINGLMTELSIGLDSTSLHKALGITVPMPEGAQS